MDRTIPRFVLAGTNSGCGKTTVTCAVLQAFLNRGLKAASFKCGPDYIDPMFHSGIIGAKSSNLDSFFLDDNALRYLLCKNSTNCDICVIEGIMGFYDGLSLDSTHASTYEIAQLTKSPVILVVNAKGASLSILAAIDGFLNFYPENNIKGVILNQCSAATYPALAKAITQRFAASVRPLGYLPNMKECTLESRHLGLVTAAEVSNLRDKVQALARQAERSVDLDGLFTLAEQAPVLSHKPIQLPRFDTPVRIAVARDNAFCFYYEDSLDILREMGAELLSFSPLFDDALPDRIHGLYLGGGYPELYAKQLSDNRSMRKSISCALKHSLPCIAECGGFMYLTQAIGDYPMVGFLKGACYDTGKLTRFGYITLQAKENCLLCSAGDTIPGHEFHYWDCQCPGDAFEARKPSGKTWDCVVANAHLYAGYPHFHFLANPAFAENFYKACLKEKQHHA